MSKGNEHREENNSMNPTLLKILLPIIAVAGVGCIGYGVYTLQNAKESEVQQAATQIEIQVKDNTQIKSETEKQVEQAMEQQAQRNQQVSKLYEKFKEELVCDKNTFVSKYSQYMERGLTAEQAYNSIHNEFAKENQIQRNEAGEVVAAETEYDAELHSLDENVEEPIVEEVTVVEETVVEYEVLEINPEDMYASQNVNLRNGPNAEDFDKIGGLSYGDKVTVVGLVKSYKDETCLWYELSTGEFVSGAYLLKELPKQEVVNSGNQGGNSGNEQSQSGQSQSSGNSGQGNGGQQSQISGNGTGGFVCSNNMGAFSGRQLQQASADSGYTGDVRLN